MTTQSVPSRRSIGHLASGMALFCACALGANVASAASVYTYQGAPLTSCTPGPASGRCYDWGPSLTGTLAFDESVVTADYTGTLDWNDGVLSLAMTLATVGTTSNLYRPPGSFVFENGELVGWDLVPQFDLPPFYVINVFSNPSGDRVSPLNGSAVLGLVGSTGGGTWSRTEPSPVPLPAAAWLLLSGLGGLGFGARPRSRSTRSRAA